MCAEELRVAIVIPNIDVYSGAVERTVRLIEYSSTAGIRYDAYLPPGGTPNPDLARDLERLAAADRVTIHRVGSKANGNASYDAIAIPTEYWWGPWKRIRSSGLRGPMRVEFHLLPYVGSLDILKSAGVHDPSLIDVVRLPFLLRATYEDAFLTSAYDTLACLLAVRALSSGPGGAVLAISRGIARQLRTLGLSVPSFVPNRPNGIDRGAIEKSLGRRAEPAYDGVFVGRFHPHKGLFDVPEIAAHMKRSGNPDVRIAMCGGSATPHHWATFQERVRAFDVGRNLIVLGRVAKEELFHTMLSSQMLIYPSYVDGFPITILESLALGLPVVAYDSDAVSMTWNRNPAVFRTSLGNPRALAGLASSLVGDGRLEAARADAERDALALRTEYSWDRVVQEQRTFYEGGSPEE